jgi:hypothetical protein
LCEEEQGWRQEVKVFLEVAAAGLGLVSWEAQE